jgi:GT2 family glycosyltransferase
MVLELTSQWVEFQALWHIAADRASGIRLCVQTAAASQIEIANLHMARCEVDEGALEEELDCVLASHQITAPSVWDPCTLVLPLPVMHGRPRYLIATVHQTSPPGWYAVHRSGTSELVGDAAIRRCGPNLLLATLAPMPATSAVALRPVDGARRADLTLGLQQGFRLAARFLTATWHAGVLSLRVAFEIDDPAILHDIPVDLEADGRVLDRAIIQPATIAGDPPSAHFEVSCSARTAQRRLRLSIPAFRMSFEVGDLSAPPPTATSTNPGVLVGAGVVEGSFEGLRVGASGALLAVGWARDPARPDAGVIVDLFVEGRPLGAARATARRRDVAAKRGGSETAGFAAELPPNIHNGKAVMLSAAPRAHRSTLTSQEREARIAPFGYNSHHPDDRPLPLLAPRKRYSGASRSCAAVILNENGADVLGPFLRSIVQFEKRTFSTIVVIDHESEDGSEELVHSLAEYLPLIFIRRPRGSSFSASNNFGASLCTEDVIFFINNDILFKSTIIGEVMENLVPDIGVAGIKLLDPPLPHSGAMAPQHIGIHFDPSGEDVLRPFESRILTDCPAAEFNVIDVPATTGAFIAVQRDLWNHLKGFDECFFYGWEDIDLSMRALALGRRNITINTASAIHIRAHSRRQMPKGLSERRARNPENFRDRWAYSLRRALRTGGWTTPGFWTGRKTQIGFVVSQFGYNRPGSDHSAASELSQAIGAILPCRGYIYDEQGVVDARGIDIMIVMSDDFDVRSMINLSGSAVLLAWANSSFHSWAIRPWRERFNYWSASTKGGQAFLEEEIGRSINLLPAATNEKWFREQGAFACALSSDIVFLGDRRYVPSDVLAALEELAQEVEIRYFGDGWRDQSGTGVADVVLPDNAELVSVYKSTRIVIDHVTRPEADWGHVSSFLLDAVAAGSFVISNNMLAAQDFFDGSLPTFSDGTSLSTSLNRYLNDDAGRISAVQAMQAVLHRRHTYGIRAGEFLSGLRVRHRSGLQIGIKISCPSMDSAQGSRDWNFARALRRELEGCGHSVRIDCADAWYGPHAAGDDVCLSLRGSDRFRAKPRQINLLWVLECPEKVSVEELDEFDHCFSASPRLTQYGELTARCGVEFLPLCTDQRIFHPVSEVPRSSVAAPLLLVSNGSVPDGPLLQAASAVGTSLQICADRPAEGQSDQPESCWTGDPPRKGDRYRAARVILVESSDDDRRWSVIPRDLFDAVACGRPILWDGCGAAETMFDGVIFRYGAGDDFGALYRRAEACSSELLAAAAELVTLHHSFSSRAQHLDCYIRRLDTERDKLRHRDKALSAPALDDASGSGQRGRQQV